MRESRGRPRPVGDLLRRVMDDLGIAPAAELERIREAWPRVAGVGLAVRASPVAYHAQTLTLRAASGPLRYEIEAFHRERLLESLRRELPSIVVARLRVIT